MRQHRTSCHRLAPTLGITPAELQALRDLDFSIPLARVRDLLHQVTADPAPSGMTVTETRNNRHPHDPLPHLVCRKGQASILLYHSPPNEHTPTGWTLVHHGDPSTLPTLHEAISAAESAMQEHIQAADEWLAKDQHRRQQRRHAERHTHQELDAIFGNAEPRR